MKKLFILFLFCLLSFHFQTSNAQEIEATVTLNKERINKTGIDHINDLPKQIQEYINTFKWTNEVYLEQEKLKCTIQINLNEVTENLIFSGSIVIQLNRPIYGTMQNTPILVLLDNTWSFSYQQNRVFIHDEFQFDDVASLIDFYMYLILGYDADTFSQLGGTKYLNRASSISDLANSSNALGWSRATKQGRTLLIQTITTPNYEDLRISIYRYHRLGLDLFTQNAEQARTNILEAIKKIRDNRKVVTELYPFDLFFNTKYRELTSLFVDASKAIKLDAYTVLIDVDPGHITKYDELQ